MNEIVRIHIAGVPYEIDVDARKQFNAYFNALKNSLGDAVDVIYDIEVRVTEILESRGVKKNDVIKLQDVAAVMEQLGEPKDFSSEEQNKNDEETGDDNRPQFAGKKFFRDTENNIVGGVFAGLAAYTGLDVTLLRVLFVLAIIFTGIFFGIIIYAVVWICAPAAKTASDRLSMKGAPINIRTIKENVESVAEKTTVAAKKAGSTVRSFMPLVPRIVIGFFGIAGLIAFVLFLAALIPFTAAAMFCIAVSAIVMKPLFVVTAVLAGLLLFTVAAIGIIVSASVFAAGLNRFWRSVLIASVIFAAVLIITGAVTGGIWLSEVGSEYAGHTVHRLINVYNLYTFRIL